MSQTPTPRPSRRPRRVRRAASVAAAGAALGLLLAGCSSMSGQSATGPGDGAADTKFVQGTGEITTVEQGHRQAAPDISGSTIDGHRLSLSDYPGKIIVLNVWGSWCDPCRAEAPNVAAVAKATAGKGVQFVGIDTRDNTAQAQAFVKAKQISYPNLVDDGNETLLTKLAGITSLGSVPSTLIIDKNGDLAWRALRPVDYNDLSAALDTVLSGQ